MDTTHRGQKGIQMPDTPVRAHTGCMLPMQVQLSCAEVAEVGYGFLFGSLVEDSLALNT